MRPVFIVGNKRSGTSLLTQILNLHPQVYVSYESDALWIIYQIRHNLAIKEHEYDNPGGLLNTIETCGNTIEMITPMSPVDKSFYKLQLACKRSTKWAMKKDVNTLLYIGDKKPVQYADPKVADFILTHFADPVFFHIIRHPKYAVASMMRKAKQGMKNFTLPPFWYYNPSEVLEHWVKFEQWVLDIKADVYTLRFEDLVNDKVSVIKNIFHYLSLDISDDAIRGIKPLNSNLNYRNFDLNLTNKAQDIMKQYDY